MSKQDTVYTTESLHAEIEDVSRKVADIEGRLLSLMQAIPNNLDDVEKIPEFSKTLASQQLYLEALFSWVTTLAKQDTTAIVALGFYLHMARPDLFPKPMVSEQEVLDSIDAIKENAAMFERSGGEVNTTEPEAQE